MDREKGWANLSQDDLKNKAGRIGTYSSGRTRKNWFRSDLYNTLAKAKAEQRELELRQDDLIKSRIEKEANKIRKSERRKFERRAATLSSQLDLAKERINDLEDQIKKNRTVRVVVDEERLLRRLNV